MSSRNNKKRSKNLPVVAVAKADYHNLYFKLRDLIEWAGGLNIDRNHIVIKINLCDARTPETGAITSPLFLDALLKYLRENYENKKITVVESEATVVLANNFIKWFGFEDILRKWEANFVNLSEVESIKVKINGRYFKEMAIPRLLKEDIFFITLAKLKTNLLTKISCSLKNQFGCLPEIDKNKYHPFLDEVIVDINSVILPHFAIVDGITAMGGAQGPAYGLPIMANIIIGGKDPVAIDAYCAKLMGFNPYFVGHIRKAYHKGLGSLKYEVVGEKINIIDFEINKLEMFLFRLGSQLKKKYLREHRIES